MAVEVPVGAGQAPVPAPAPAPAPGQAPAPAPPAGAHSVGPWLKRWWWVLALVAVVLVVVLVVVQVVNGSGGGTGKTEKVPALQGMTIGEADAALAVHGLHRVNAFYRLADTGVSETVVETVPAKDADVAKGGDVAVTVLLVLKGTPTGSATAALDRLGITWHRQDQPVRIGPGIGTVLATDPGSGQRAAQSVPVTLSVGVPGTTCRPFCLPCTPGLPFCPIDRVQVVPKAPGT